MPVLQGPNLMSEPWYVAQSLESLRRADGIFALKMRLVEAPAAFARPMVTQVVVNPSFKV